MKGFLNNEQIEYVLFHLGHHIELSETIRKSFIFIHEGESPGISPGKIIFILTAREINEESVLYINDLPVLSPVTGYKKTFEVRKDTLIFTMDLLKSCFFLLSGYQERDNSKPDSLGRFEYNSSIQYKMNFLIRPAVNYYFEELINGIEEYCSIHKIECRRKKPFKNFCFFLTHDVDRISYFNLNSLLFTVKQLAGLSISERKKSWLLRELLRIGFNILILNRKKDPYWNFKYLADLEKESGIHSTWFFLPKDQRHVDSYYNFNDNKVRTLIRFLRDRGHEAGLHGTVRSHISYEALKTIKEQLKDAAGKEIAGIRQHRLMWNHSITPLIHDSAGLLYDSTLGFAGYEGFRNSYCFPFKLFDFENNRMMSTWEIPLNIMDLTLFDYRKLNFDESKKSIFYVIDEIKKFNGVFTLLWHNSYLDEKLRPGINMFYSEILKTTMEKNPESLNGTDIITRMNELQNG